MTNKIEEKWSKFFKECVKCNQALHKWIFKDTPVYTFDKFRFWYTIPNDATTCGVCHKLLNSGEEKIFTEEKQAIKYLKDSLKELQNGEILKYVSIIVEDMKNDFDYRLNCIGSRIQKVEETVNELESEVMK